LTVAVKPVLVKTRKYTFVITQSRRTSS